MWMTVVGQAAPGAPVDTSGHTGAVVAAVVITLGIVLLLCLSAGPPVSKVLLGSDQRLSTSKTISLAWTGFVATVFLAQLLIALPAKGDVLTNFENQWDHFPAETYLLLLGGPYAALVLSKLTVQSKLNSGDLQKVDGDGKVRASDLVTDDAGNIALPDLQYTVFNIVALIFAVAVFVKRPAMGLPDIPQGIAALSSASALTYLGTKAVAKSGPFIESTLPVVAAVGETVVLTGRNFVPPTSPTDPEFDGRPRVLVGGIAAQVGDDFSDSCVRFTVPAGVPVGPADVVVNTAGKGNTKAQTRITVR